MKLPDRAQLEAEIDVLDTEVASLHEAYQTFRSKWEALQNKQQQVLMQLQEHTDHRGLASVLSHINSLDE